MVPIAGITHHLTSANEEVTACSFEIFRRARFRPFHILEPVWGVCDLYVGRFTGEKEVSVAFCHPGDFQTAQAQSIFDLHLRATLARETLLGPLGLRFW